MVSESETEKFIVKTTVNSFWILAAHCQILLYNPIIDRKKYCKGISLLTFR